MLSLVLYCLLALIGGLGLRGWGCFLLGCLAWGGAGWGIGSLLGLGGAGVLSDFLFLSLPALFGFC